MVDTDWFCIIACPVDLTQACLSELTLHSTRCCFAHKLNKQIFLLKAHFLHNVHSLSHCPCSSLTLDYSIIIIPHTNSPAPLGLQTWTISQITRLLEKKCTIIFLNDLGYISQKHCSQVANFVITNIAAEWVGISRNSNSTHRIFANSVANLHGWNYSSQDCG